MKQIVVDENLVSFCGLYCGACRRYLEEKCKGCRENLKAAWCQVRSCCLKNQFGSCADCRDFTEVNDCRKFNNFISKLFGFLFRSDRRAGIQLIKKAGKKQFAEKMALASTHAMRR